MWSGVLLSLQPRSKSKSVSPIVTLIRYVIGQLPQQIDSQSPDGAIPNLEREIGRRRGEWVKGVAVVNHVHGQASIAYRQNDYDGVIVRIIVSILDAVDDEFLDSKKNQVQHLGRGLIRLEPAFRFSAGARNRIKGIKHFYSQTLAHDVPYSGWDW
jgi:hypothetical protein